MKNLKEKKHFFIILKTDNMKNKDKLNINNTII